MRVYAQVVAALLRNAGAAPASVRAIGAHGQTVRHRPQEFDGTGYTLQLCQPALLAELTGIDVVADFRSRDVAAGGQGAPLAPFFHRSCVRAAGETWRCSTSAASPTSRCCARDGAMLGFDCGPGNALMDSWCVQHTGASPTTPAGAWAASGQVVAALLETLLAEPYFGKPPPKSTGRDLFNQAWLQGHLQRLRRAPRRPMCRRPWRSSLRGPAARRAALAARPAPPDRLRRRRAQHPPDAAPGALLPQCAR